MHLTKQQFFIIIGVVAIILIVILALTVGRKTPQPQAATLTFWGVGDDGKILQPVFDLYQQSHPEVTIEYTEFDESNYENSLINAFASNKGPDIFMFHRSWLPKHKDKIFALSKTKIPLTKFQQLFPDVAAEDFSDGENVYALPIYIDTLSLIYNKDIFNSSAVAMPPKTWDEFKILIPKIRKIDNRTGAILRAAGAIGGTQNSIHNASDILDLIMMQFGVSFPKSAAEKVSLRDAEEALNFYTDFANASSLFYTWDDKFGDSLEVFSNGKTAIIFDYQSIIKNLKEKNPYLNIKSSPMLQFDLDNPINYPNYWGLAISNKSRNPIAAQDFILAFTTDEKIAEAYLKSSGHPPALRSLIARYQNDPDLGIFTKQALSARSWYQIDYNFINQTFSDMIESVIMNRSSIKDALEIAQNKINSFSISQ